MQATFHHDIDPESGCPGRLRPRYNRTRNGWQHTGKFSCTVCHHRFTRYPDHWLKGNPLSPLERERIAQATQPTGGREP